MLSGTTAALASELRARHPAPGNTYWDLAALLERGALTLALGEGEPVVDSSGVQLMVGSLDPAEVARAWWAAVVVRRPASQRLEVPPSPLQAIGQLNGLVDPGRFALARAMAALADPPPAATDAAALVGWRRAQLWRSVGDRADASAGLAPLFVSDPGPPPPPRQDPGDDAARVHQIVEAYRHGAQRVGIIGGAAAGKSSLADAISAAMGPALSVLRADDFTWPGSGFRYTQRDRFRETLLTGAYITNHLALRRAVAACDGQLLVEGTTTGWDPLLRATLDLLVGIHLPAAARLRRKRARNDNRRIIALELDFAEKQHTEIQDVCWPLMRDASIVWHRTGVDSAPLT